MCRLRSYGATYQTELESFQQVTAKGSVGGGSAYFEVLAKGGTKLVFGNSLSNEHLECSIDPITGAVASWGISYLEDKHGNRVIYDYTDAGTTINGSPARQILPNKITYGHNGNAGVVGKLAVEFVYENRPDNRVGFARGQQFVSDVRMSNIQTFYDGDLVKDYRVSYEQSPVSQRSRITQIVECSGAGKCLLPISFSWNDYSIGWQQGVNLPAAALTTQGSMRGAAVDVNNDGHTDWITAIRDANGNVDLQTYLNHNGNWSAASGFDPPSPIFDYQLNVEGVSVSGLVDINGNGLLDIVQAHQYTDGSSAQKTWLNTGNGWT